MRRTHQLAAQIFDNTDKQGGTILRKARSRYLYILFTYFGHRVEKSTGLNDTSANRKKVRTWLDRIIEKRDAGQLIFADAFPGASEAEKATFAQLEGWTYAPEPKDVFFGEYVKV